MSMSRYERDAVIIVDHLLTFMAKVQIRGTEALKETIKQITDASLEGGPKERKFLAAAIEFITTEGD